jgi:hypothetical protein
LLGIGARRQPHFNVVAVVVIRADQRVLFQEIPVAFVFNLHVVLAVTRLDALEIALQNGRAVVDETDAVAQLLHLVHAMRGKQDCLALLLQVEQNVFEQGGINGIETEEWLVHDDEVRVMQQRGNKLNFLLHALGKLFHLLFNPGIDLQPLAPLHRFLPRRAGGKTMQLAQKNELINDLHFFIKPALFGKVPDTVQALAFKRLAKKMD